jgi:alpha-glucosidase (family GH31 glycosyl hydrolase)
MRKAIRIKYHLSKYYQSEISFIHDEGGAFYKPLFFEFPDDPRSYYDLNLNVMIGSGLKLAVQSNTIGQNTTEFYFPPGGWCNVFNPEKGCSHSNLGEIKELPTKADDFYLHIREGYIVPMQNATVLNINTTA